MTSGMPLTGTDIQIILTRKTVQKIVSTYSKYSFRQQQFPLRISDGLEGVLQGEWVIIDFTRDKVHVVVKLRGGIDLQPFGHKIGRVPFSVTADILSDLTIDENQRLCIAVQRGDIRVGFIPLAQTQVNEIIDQIAAEIARIPLVDLSFPLQIPGVEDRASRNDLHAFASGLEIVNNQLIVHFQLIEKPA